MTTVGTDKAGDHVEDRGFAGAIRAEQSDCFAPTHVERHASDHHTAGSFLPHHGQQDMRDALPAVRRCPARLRGCLIFDQHKHAATAENAPWCARASAGLRLRRALLGRRQSCETIFASSRRMSSSCLNMVFL